MMMMMMMMTMMMTMMMMMMMMMMMTMFMFVRRWDIYHVGRLGVWLLLCHAMPLLIHTHVQEFSLSVLGSASTTKKCVIRYNLESICSKERIFTPSCSIRTQLVVSTPLKNMIVKLDHFPW